MILLHNIVDVKLPPWKMHLSSAKLYKRYYLRRSNNDLKCLVRNVREWLEKYSEDVRNKLTLYFDYNT